MSDKEPNKEDGEALHTLGGAGSTPNVKTVKWDGTEFVKRNGKQKSEDDTFSTIGCRPVVELCLCSLFGVASSVETKQFTFWFRYSMVQITWFPD